MKKFISLIFLGLFSLCVFSQSTMKSYSTRNITPSNWSFSIATGAADSLGVVQDSIQVPIFINSMDSVKAFFRLKLTEVTSAARITVQHQSKKHNLDSYTTRWTTTYTGVGADSTIYFKSLSPYLSDPYQRVLLIRVGNKAYVSDLSGWFYK